MEKIQTSKSAELTEAAAPDEKPSAANSVIFLILCAALAFAVIAFGAVDVWALGILALLAGAIALLWIFDAWRMKEFRFDANLLQLPIAGLILIGLIQLLPLRGLFAAASDLLSVPPASALSLAPYATRFAVIQLIIYFIFFAAALRFINNQKRLRRLVAGIIAFGATAAFFGILQRLADPTAIYGLRPTPQAIFFSTFVNQHHFAAFMVMTIGLTLALLFGKATKNDKRLLLAIAAVVMGIAILFTGSRGGLISLFGVLGFVLAATLFGKGEADEHSEGGSRKIIPQKIAVIGGGLALIVILFGSILLLGGEQSLLRGVGWDIGQTDITNGRRHFWYTALQIIKDYPILGAGLDSFGVAFTRYDTWNGAMRVEQAHNDYLQILADAGILGFICVAGFIYLFLKQSFQLIGNTKDRFRRFVAVGALAGCFGVLLHSFFDFPLRTPSNALFFLVFVVLATASISHSQNRLRKRAV